MILSDKQILQIQSEWKIFDPFYPSLISKVDEQKVLSYGLGGCGYDLTLSGSHILMDTPLFVPPDDDSYIVDPKRPNPSHFEKVTPFHDEEREESYYLLPSHTFCLGVLNEKINLPSTISLHFLGKSSYARAGVFVNITPAEPGWRGYLTVEIFNSGSKPVKLYAYEGICQAIINKHDSVENCYDRKYQDQPKEPTLSR